MTCLVCVDGGRAEMRQKWWVGCGCAGVHTACLGAACVTYIENECFSNDEDSDRHETEGTDLEKNPLQAAHRTIIQ